MEEYVQINMLKVGFGMDSLLCTLLFVVKVPGEGGGGHWPSMACHSADKHQPAAALVTGDTNTSFRSQQITFEKLTACYHSGWGAKGGGGTRGGFISCSFL